MRGVVMLNPIVSAPRTVHNGAVGSTARFLRAVSNLRIRARSVLPE